MKLKILKNWGTLKKDQIFDANGNTAQYLLSNGIASMAPNDDCIGDCDDHDENECEGCKSKKKKRSAGHTGSVKIVQTIEPQPEKTAPVVKKKVAPKKVKAKKSIKKTASPKK